MSVDRLMDGVETAGEYPARGPLRLDPESRLPLYHQLFLLLRSRIFSGEVGPGGPIPGEQDLVSEFGVSRITAKRALDELAAAGLVTRQRGRGTRVVDRPPVPAVSTSFEGWLENTSLMGIATTARVLEFRYVPASDDVASALQVTPGAIVQRAVRVRELDGAPMSYLVTHVPEEIGRRFDRKALGKEALLTLLERADVKVAAAEQTITATLADADIAAALDTHAGAPLLDVRRIVSDEAGRPVEYIHVLYRPDRYRLAMAMRRVQKPDGMRWAAEPDAMPANVVTPSVEN